jgi:hypothetical protein
MRDFISQMIRMILSDHDFTVSFWSNLITGIIIGGVIAWIINKKITKFGVELSQKFKIEEYTRDRLSSLSNLIVQIEYVISSLKQVKDQLNNNGHRIELYKLDMSWWHGLSLIGINFEFVTPQIIQIMISSDEDIFILRHKIIADTRKGAEDMSCYAEDQRLVDINNNIDKITENRTQNIAHLKEEKLKLIL